MKPKGLLLACALLLFHGPALAETIVKLGVLTDLSGPYSDLSGKGSVIATQMAAEDFKKQHPDFKIDVISADHQNKPDIGSALVYAAALVGVLLIAGVRWLHLAVFAVVAVVLALSVLWWLPSAGMPVLKGYQTSRLTGFFHPDQDPRGSTYNVTQSITAVGSGGPTGRGVVGATQTSLDFLPEHATDFVFASLAEQRGFFGAGFLLMLYLLVVWRGLKAVASARDPYSAIVAGGIVFALLFQIFVNVGMTIGIAPVTGIPLPLVSVGGSSMIANLLAIGVLQAIYVRGRGRTRIARW